MTKEWKYKNQLESQVSLNQSLALDLLPKRHLHREDSPSITATTTTIGRTITTITSKTIGTKTGRTITSTRAITIPTPTTIKSLGQSLARGVLLESQRIRPTSRRNLLLVPTVPRETCKTTRKTRHKEVHLVLIPNPRQESEINLLRLQRRRSHHQGPIHL